jgi:hypothetical protein
MQTLIDLLTTNDWLATDSTISVSKLDYPIEWESNALQVDFLVDGYIDKDFSVSVLECDSILICIPFCENETSFEIIIDGLKNSIVLSRTYQFKTSFGKQYYQFMNEFDSISHIRIISLEQNKIVIRNLVAYKDEIPYDIGEGIKKLIEQYTPVNAILIGKVTCSANANFIIIQGQPKYIEKYSVITFNNEVHQVESYKTTSNSYEIRFTQLYNGKQTINASIDQDVYITIQVLNMPKDIESNNPCIVIEGGFISEKMFFLGNNLEDVIHTGNNLNYTLSRLSLNKYTLNIHALYRSLELKHLLFNILSELQGFSKVIWINSKRHVIDFGNIIDNEEEGIGELQLSSTINYEVNKWMNPLSSLIESEVIVNII